MSIRTNNKKTRTAIDQAHGVDRLGRAARVGVAGLLAVSAMVQSPHAHAALITQSLDFTADRQSIWGPDAVSQGFDFSNSTSVNLPFDLGTFSVGYAVGASTGQVWGNVNGNLRTNYVEVLSSPGSTSIDLSYFGDTNGGRLQSTIGARAQLTSSVGNVGPNYTLDINRTYTPVLDSPVTGSAARPDVAQLALVNVIAAQAGVEMGVSQADRFTPTGVGGTLFYSRQGSGVMNSLDYLLGTNGGTSLGVDLLEAGIWDFWFGDFELTNAFSTSLAMTLGLYAETLVGCGTLGLESCRANTTLLSPTVYSGDPFALDFRAASLLDGFSIEVLAAPMAVPEPSSLALLGLGSAGLILRRRRRAGSKA